MNKRNSTPADFELLESLSGGEYCYKKNIFVYALSRELSGTEIRLIELSSGAERVLVTGGRNPRLSPDGERLCYLFRGQIWLFDISSGKKTQLTNMRFHTTEPLWSPGGDMISFLSACAADADTDLLRTAKTEEEQIEYELEMSKRPVVIENFGYKFDGLGFHQPEHMHIWVINSEGGKAWRLTDGEFDHMHHNWSPDGKNIIFISSRCRDKKEALANDLFSVPAEGGEIKRLTSSGWLSSYPTPFRPMFTPDGKYIIAAMFDEKETDMGKGLPFAYLHRIAADGSGDVNIFPKDAPCHECVQFPYNTGAARCYDKAQISSDGQYCIFCSGVDGACNLYRASIYGEPIIEALTAQKWAIAGLDKPQGGYVAVSLGNIHGYGDYWLFSETGESIKQITHSNLWLNEIALSEPEEMWIDCLDKESRVQGWVLPPQNAVPGGKYPAVLYIHGGPHPFYTFGFDLEHHMLAGAGFAVIYCNPRGSSSYGRVHENPERAFDGAAYTDLLQFTEEACRRFGFIDEELIGVTGGSYGGYMTNYMSVHSHKFRAYITQRSIANEQIEYASSDMQGDSSKYKSFEDFMVRNLEKSAVSYAENLNAPFLILHGLDDLRCPVEQAHQLFTAFRDVHPEIPVKMILYPDCGHDQPGGKNLIHYYNSMLEWFKTYLSTSERKEQQ